MTEDTLARLRALEKENEELRRKASNKKPTAPATPPRPKETTCRETSYKGFPVITFEGPFRPFSLGARKAAVILSKLKEMERFVANNKKNLKDGQPDEAGLWYPSGEGP